MVASKPKEEMSLFELGRHVYRAVCAFCHGLGTPQNPASPSLEGIGDRLSEEQIASLMETGAAKCHHLPPSAHWRSKPSLNSC